MSIEGQLGPITPRDAEYVAASIMRDHLGFKDARVTTASSDGGVDVRSREAIAQVKHWGSTVGRPAVQQLYGARGADHSKKMIFFCSGGYSRQAIQYADEVGMALFVFDAVGRFRAVNRCARQLHLTVKRQNEWEKTKSEIEAEKASKHAAWLARVEAGDIPKITWRTWLGIPFLLLALLGVSVEFGLSADGPDSVGIAMLSFYFAIATLSFLRDFLRYRNLKRLAKSESDGYSPVPD